MQFMERLELKTLNWFSRMVGIDSFILYHEIFLGMNKTLIYAGIFAVTITMMIPTLEVFATNTSDNAWHYWNQKINITNRFDHAKICGDHYCTPGEYQSWSHSISAAQRSSYGVTSSGQHGENVMNGITGSPSGSPMHGAGRVGYTNSTSP